jgi:hypothetical protein
MGCSAAYVKGRSMKHVVTAVALVLALSAGALAQSPQQVRVRGTIAAYAAGTLTVTTPTGPRTIALTPDVRVQYVVASDFAHIAPGSWIGTAATQLPDGTLRAIEIHVFPPGATPGAGFHPYDLGASSTMTNGSVDTIGSAQVDNVAAHTLAIRYPDGKKTVVVPPGTPVVAFAPAAASALVPGAHVVLFALRADDGSLSATNVNVGKDGLVPPM